MAPVTWDDHEVPNMAVPAKRWCVRLLSLAGPVLTTIGTASFGIAQTTTSQLTVWNGVYTEAQAARGMMAYGQSCMGCHALTAEGKTPLVGESFWKSFAQKSVGELLEYVSTYMPNGTPGSLSKSTYEDIVALILKSNGFPAGATEVASNTISNIKIVPKDGSTELPANALARVIGCLARSGTDWAVSNATTPERAERVHPPGEDATRALGTRTIPLKFVVTKLDSLAGSRIVVTGLLMGIDGVDGINVTTVNRVSQKCP
jgi:S-disulfanyl-L-cysteine oxidoreductase SoxD